MVPVPPPGPAPTERFLRAFRLTTGRQFTAVLARGFRIAEKHVVVHFLANDLPSSRLGVTLSRRVGGAVIRNRVRRRLREVFRRRLRVQVDALAPADVVVRVLPGAGGVALEALEAELLHATATWRGRTRGTRDRGAPPRPPRPQ